MKMWELILDGGAIGRYENLLDAEKMMLVDSRLSGSPLSDYFLKEVVISTPPKATIH